MDFTRILDLIKDPDLKIKISDLVSENLQLKENNFKLNQQIKKSKNDKEIQSKLIFENNHYFIFEDNKRNGPYCTNCWDSDKNLLRLHQGNLHNGLTHFICPKCKTSTSTGEYIQPTAKGIDW